MPDDLSKHPGYAKRYGLRDRKEYWVPIGTPRNARDKAAQDQYDKDVYGSRDLSPGDKPPDTAYDPDTGAQGTWSVIQQGLAKRYPRQTPGPPAEQAPRPIPVTPGAALQSREMGRAPRIATPGVGLGGGPVGE